MPSLTEVIKGLVRSTSEKFEDYRNRIFSEKRLLKAYLKGRIIKPGSIHIPKSTKDRKATKKKFRWLKVKSRRRMQKASRKTNYNK